MAPWSPSGPYVATTRTLSKMPSTTLTGNRCTGVFQSQEGVDGCRASATHRRGFQPGGSASGHEADCRCGSGRRPLRNRRSRFRASRGRVRDWGKLSGSRHRVSHPAASRAHSSRRWRGAFRGGCARGERADACCLSAKRPADAASARRKRPPRDACAATRLIAAVWDENGILRDVDYRIAWDRGRGERPGRFRSISACDAVDGSSTGT
jgi:hypothetical protein